MHVRILILLVPVVRLYAVTDIKSQLVLFKMIIFYIGIAMKACLESSSESFIRVWCFTRPLELVTLMRHIVIRSEDCAFGQSRSLIRTI